jgi:hypothetical protein
VEYAQYILKGEGHEKGARRNIKTASDAGGSEQEQERGPPKIGFRGGPEKKIGIREGAPKK